MKLKYYLRGLAVGILVTTVILAISFSQSKKELSDQEVINRAKELGMVMADSGKIGEHRNDTQTPNEEPDDVVDTENQTETGQSEHNEMEENVTGGTQTDTEETQTDTEGTQTDTEETQTGTEEKIVTFIISKGQFGRQISESLKKEGLVDDEEAFMKYLGETGKSEEILPGTYEIPMGSTYEEIVKILLAPKPLG